MILEKLFGGQFYPTEEIGPIQDKGYVQSRARVSELLTTLEETLNEADYALVDELHTEVLSMQLKENEAHFSYGFASGIQLSKETAEILTRCHK
jgi:hypothetical protein